MKTAMFAAVAASLLGSAALGFAAPAMAGEAFVGVYKHDVTFIGKAVGLGAAGREDGYDVHLGYRTDKLENLRWLGKPQVHTMVSINSENKSNFVAAGFDWKLDFGQPGGFYLRPGMGLAYTDGKAKLPPANAPNISDEERARRTYLYYHRIEFGSHVLFEPELALGYQVSDKVSVELSYTHLSNGQIFHQGKNQGLDDAGVRLVYAF
ncbi:acyloxyacyl hydrolase [Caulobacter segnis]|jgi:opacity protein-like surface antigen|uniref:acyloxyacyl hydrolase n=1 Tax=Caulobacter segnis TaxID=88688 RepID=UPI001CC16429|nr:acyloxyacyl hydrolase [Caulobacter segnis]UAL11475.1 acyloxyacyl hydrolase [Caulobacter segnis]